MKDELVNEQRLFFIDFFKKYIITMHNLHS